MQCHPIRETERDRWHRLPVRFLLARVHPGIPHPTQNFPPYTFSKNPSPSNFFSQLVSTRSSTLIAPALGFCSATYLMTIRVPSREGYGFRSSSSSAS